MKVKKKAIQELHKPVLPLKLAMRKLKRRPAITLPPCLFQPESPGPLKNKLETVMGVEIDSAQGVENR